MDLNPVASTFLVIGYLVFALITALAVGALALALAKVNAKLEELVEKVEPQLVKIDEMLTMTNEKIASIGDKAEGILSQGEETAENVHHKVEQTATAVQRTIHAPIISLNSLVAGVSRGVSTFGHLQRGDVTSVPEANNVRGGVAAGNGHPSIATVEKDKVPALAGKETLNGG